MKMTRSTYHPAQHALSLLILAFLVTALICIPAFAHRQLFASDEGGIELTMRSELPNMTAGNGMYSLADARFGVFSDYECTNKAGELVTDEQGMASISDLNAGRYFIRQEQASRGFAMSDRLLQADVAVSKNTSAEISCMPAHAEPSVLLREVNSETGSSSGIGGASLGKAVYVVSYYDSLSPDSTFSGATRTWEFESGESGEVVLSNESLLSGSPLFTDASGTPVMPLGRYTVSMSKEPQGFLRSYDALTGEVTYEPQASLDPLCNFPVFEESLQPIRGDVMFRKTDANGTPLEGIPFLLTCESDGSDDARESHVIVTNGYGDFCSHADYVAHDANTNASDQAVIASVDSTYKLDEELLNSHAGIWFSKDGAGTPSSAQNARGALPYGSYVLQELPCSKNEGMNLSSVRFSVHRNDYTVVLDNIVNTAPGISGFAYESKSLGKLVRPNASVDVSNEISYKNLIPGKRYTLSATAQVSSTGASVPGPDGSPAFAFIELTPHEPSGAAIVELSLDTSGLAGEKLIVSSELKSEDGMVVHQSNETSGEQELTVEPIVALSATDALDSDKYCMGADAAVYDRMSYEGLRTDATYTLICSLNDKATGNALRDAQGNAISASVNFIPEARRGYVDVILPFDANAVAGHDIVVFDKLFDENGTVIASHQDIDDVEQTVKTVKLASSAFDKSDGDKMFDANAASVVICDTVNYANLEPGKQYVFHGALMDKETGSALMENGAPVTATVPFVPEEVSGSTDVEYSFDASNQSSQVIVAFETLKLDGNTVAQHADLEDVAQTVTSEEVGADGAMKTQTGYGKGAGSPVTTGDLVMRAVMAALAVAACSAACIGYAVRHKRKTLEAIARLSDSQR